MITRVLFLSAELAAVFAIYYGYGLVASAEIPLHMLTVMLIATDRCVETIRSVFDARSRPKPADS